MQGDDTWKTCLYARDVCHWRIDRKAWCWLRDVMGGPDGALFGCHFIGIGYRSIHAKDAWHKYGRFEGELWRIDKALLLVAITEYVDHYRLERCPEWDWERVHRVLRNLPDVIDPKHPDWCSVEDWREGWRQAVSVDYVGDVRKLRFRLLKGGKDEP